MNVLAKKLPNEVLHLLRRNLRLRATSQLICLGEGHCHAGETPSHQKKFPNTLEFRARNKPGDRSGIYLFTVPGDEGLHIYWVGQTSQPVRTRIATHSREFLAGTYNILDVDKLRAGERAVLWKGLWWRKDSADRYEEYLLRAGEVAPLVLSQLRSTHIYIVPAPKERRFLARLEAGIVNALYIDPDVGTILDRGYSLAPRWETEDVVQVRFRGPEFRGLPRVLSV